MELKQVAYELISKKVGAQEANKQIMHKEGGESVESYLDRISATICGNDDEPMACGGDQASKCGTPQCGYRCQFQCAKSAWEDAETNYKEWTSKCAKLQKQYSDKVIECDNLQDQMDEGACKRAVEMKDACETYAECFTSKKQAYEEAEHVVKKDEEDPAVLVGVWRERRQDLEEELRQLQKRQQVQQEERASLKDSIKLMNLQISSISKKTREFDAQAGRGASARVDSLTVELRACEDALSKAQQEVSVCQADVTLYKQLYEEAANRTNAELESMSRRRGLGTPQPACTPKAQKPAKGIPPVHATPVGTPPKTLNDVRKRRDEWARNLWPIHDKAQP